MSVGITICQVPVKYVTEWR